jgi:hypothetical protein
VKALIINKKIIIYLSIAFLGFLISILTFFLGWISPDSVAQYGNAQVKTYFDWHPALMAIWWR